MPEIPENLERMEYTETAKLRAAYQRAAKIYPPPVAKVIELEIQTWCDMGYRFGGFGVMADLVKSIMATPIPNGAAETPEPPPNVKAPPKPRITSRPTIHTPLPKPPNATES